MGTVLGTGKPGPRRVPSHAAYALALALFTAIALIQPAAPASAAAADLSVSVTPAGDDLRRPAGVPTDFVVTVNNSGDTAATDVTLDLAPFGLVLNGTPPEDGVECGAPDGAGGGNGHNVTCSVTSIPANGAKSITFNGTGSPGTRTQTITVSQGGEVGDTLTRTIDFFNRVDLAVTIPKPTDGNGGTLRAGDPVTVRVLVSNLGPDTATGVTADVAIPSWRSSNRDDRCNEAYACTLGDLANETSTLVFEGSFDPAAEWPRSAVIEAQARDGDELTDDLASPNDAASLSLAVAPAPSSSSPGEGDGETGGDGSGDGDGDSGGAGGAGGTEGAGGSGGGTSPSVTSGSRGGATNPVPLPSVAAPGVAAPQLTGVGLGLPTVGNGVDLPMVGPNPAAPAGKGGGPRADDGNAAKVVPPTILIALLILLAWVALPSLSTRRVRIRRR